MENNQKLSYTITWTQPYSCSMNFIVIDLNEEFEKIIESQLENNNFTEATEIINKIRNKK